MWINKVILSCLIITFVLSCADEKPVKKNKRKIYKQRTKTENQNREPKQKKIKKIPFQDIEAEWKYGVAIKNGKPKYFDPERINDYSPMMMPDYYRNKFKNKDEIKGFKLYWSGNKDTGMLWYANWDVKKKNRAWEEFINEKGKIDYKPVENELHYHLTNDSVYLSEDQTNWEKLEIKFYQNEPHYDFDTGIGEDYKGSGIFWKMHLKSSWFEGEYIITSMHIDR